jgi:hypothetical protein
MPRASLRRRGASPALRAALVALLALALPGGSLDALARESAVPPPGTTALTVASDPEGAAVYVNGERRGETPVTLNHVAPGDVRVRLVKPGYLENSRVVSVKSGEAGQLRVRMTPGRGEARHALQQEPGGGGGGGSKKALWIGLGVVAAGAGAYLLLRDSNDPPNAGTISANPPTALQSATLVSLSAQGASDPDGDPLTFSWDFGDGGTGSGEAVTHVFTAAGAANVRLTVSDGEDSTTATGTVSVRNLSGTWVGTIAGGGVFNTTVVLAQSGATLTGTYRDQSPGTGAVNGTVSDQRSVSFRVAIPGFQPFNFTGNANPDINQITGVANGSGFVNDTWTLTRQ